MARRQRRRQCRPDGSSDGLHDPHPHQRHGARQPGTSLGIWEFSANVEYVDRRRSVKPQLRSDLVALPTALGVDGGILITIDEVSSGKVRLREFSKFALQVSHALEDGAQIMIVFAGVKVSLDALLAEEHTTFLRRSREIEFERLSAPETRRVLTETAGLGGRRIDDPQTARRGSKRRWP